MHAPRALAAFSPLAYVPASGCAFLAEVRADWDAATEPLAVVGALLAARAEDGEDVGTLSVVVLDLSRGASPEEAGVAGAEVALEGLSAEGDGAGSYALDGFPWVAGSQVELRVDSALGEAVLEVDLPDVPLLDDLPPQLPPVLPLPAPAAAAWSVVFTGSEVTLDETPDATTSPSLRTAEPITQVALPPLADGADGEARLVVTAVRFTEPDDVLAGNRYATVLAVGTSRTSDADAPP
jgi:hypothetical protein